MGIRKPIESGGLFPPFLSPASMPPEAVLALKAVPNHQSFRDLQSCARPPGHDVIEQHVNQKFGLLFRSKAEAEAYLGSASTPAPLGTVSKQKDDGAWKHRVILDLRANCVNLSAATPERQVLPTVHSHAADLAHLASGARERGHEVWNLILDIRDAFMGIPLASCEQPFNCCSSDLPIVRQRAPLYKGEP